MYRILVALGLIIAAAGRISEYCDFRRCGLEENHQDDKAGLSAGSEGDRHPGQSSSWL